jgi:trigger factor
LRQSTKKWIERKEIVTVDIGCKVIIDLNVTTFYGKKKKSEDIKDFDVLMINKTVNDDLWKNLIGAKISETRDFSVAYPLDFREKAFGGKTVDYRVHIKKIFVAAEHELNDDFAKDAGYESFEALKKSAIDTDTNYCERLSRDIMRRDLLDKISDMYDFPVPEKMLKFETKEIIRQIREEAQKLNKEFTPYIESECVKIAEKRVRLGFVVAKIAKKEGVTVSKNEISHAISIIARMHPGNEKTIWNAYSRPENLPVIIGPILESKVIDVLISRIKVSEEVKCSFDELVAIDEEPFDFFKDDALPEMSKEPEALGDKSEEEKKDVTCSSDEPVAVDEKSVDSVENDVPPETPKEPEALSNDSEENSGENASKKEKSKEKKTVKSRKKKSEKQIVE